MRQQRWLTWILVLGLPAGDEAEAIRRIQELGGHVQPLAESDGRLDVDLHLGGKDVADEDLALLADLPGTARLNLGGTKVTDDGLKHLSHLSELTHLYLHNTSLTGPGLVHLKGLAKLECLNLYGTRVGDEALAHLVPLPSLQRVFLWQTEVTVEGAGELLLSLPDLEINLGHDAPPLVPPRRFTEEGMAAARQRIAELGGAVRRVSQDSEDLEVDFHIGARAVTDADLEVIASLPQVIEINLTHCDVGDAGLAHLGRIRELERLHLARTSVTDAGLVHLRPLGRLVYLNLYGTAVTDAGLEVVGGLASLEKLYVWQTAVTAAGIEPWSSKRPNLRIDRGFEWPVEPQPAKAEPATVAADATCCEKAKAAGRECDHPCCVAAAAEGKLCEKCNPGK